MFIPSQLVPFVHEDEVEPSTTDFDAKGGGCPVDGTILIRTEINLAPPHGSVHLERCSSCRGVWFDRGEWSILADQYLLEDIEKFWTAEWRARQGRQRSAVDYEERIREEFGAELFGQLEAIARTLKGHERRSQALTFINEASSE